MRKEHRSSRGSSEPKVLAKVAPPVSQTAAEQSVETELSEGSSGRGEWRGIYTVIPVMLAVLASINTLWNGFAADDQQQILGNALIKDLGNLFQAFTTSVWSFSSTDIRFALDTFYRPVFNVLLTVNYALFGTAPWGWHLVNILIHGLVTWLVFVVLNELTGQRWVALVAAALFAVHPVHSESIAWLSGITDPLMASFALSSFYFYIKYRRSGRRHLMAVALALFLTALLSKETALAMPVVCALYELVCSESPVPLRQRLSSAAGPLLLFAIPIATYFLMRSLALGAATLGGEPIYSLDYALKTTPLLVLKYLKLFLIPNGYSYQHYSPFVTSFASIRFIAPLLTIAAIVIAVWRAKSKLVTFASGWFALWLAPSLAVMRQYDSESLVQERYLYLPSIGFCLALALVFVSLHQRRPLGLSRHAMTGAGVLLIVVWGVVLFRQNLVWRNNITLYQNCVAVEPNSPAARAALSMTYADAGRFREADEHATAAIDIDPQYVGSYLNLSYKAKRLGKIDEAIQHLETAVSTVSEGPLTRTKLATVYLNLGLLYSEQKDFVNADQKLLRSIELWPRPVGWYYAGMNYFSHERYQQAIGMFEEVIRRVPSTYAPIHLTVGATYEKLGNIERARAEYEKFLELTPTDSPEKKSVREKLAELEGRPKSAKP